MANIALFDFNRTLFNPDMGVLFPGALGCLSNLRQQGTILILLTTYSPGRNLNLFNKLGIADLFDSCRIVDQKTVASFLEILNGFENSRTFVIGDRLDEEILIGNDLNLTTIWINQPKATDTPLTGIPDYTINSLDEIAAIIGGTND